MPSPNFFRDKERAITNGKRNHDTRRKGSKGRADDDGQGMAISDRERKEKGLCRHSLLSTINLGHKRLAIFSVPK